MRSKHIRYFMAKDTRLILSNLTKVIIDEDTVVVKYTVFRTNFDDITINAIKYSKSKKTMIIYDELRKHNKHIYYSFIEWAEENEIKWYRLGGEDMYEK